MWKLCNFVYNMYSFVTYQLVHNLQYPEKVELLKVFKNMLMQVKFEHSFSYFTKILFDHSNTLLSARKNRMDASGLLI